MINIKKVWRNNQMSIDKIEVAKEKFGKLIEEQLARVERMKADKDFIDYASLPVIKIGICGGDGIGPAITAQAQRILEFLLADEVEKGKVEFKVIDGLTIENRIKANKAIPDDVLAELKECPVILKGPTTTPRAGDKVNIESANVAMRKELDLLLMLDLLEFQKKVLTGHSTEKILKVVMHLVQRALILMMI